MLAIPSATLLGVASVAFALYGWCAAIRGVEGGGLVEGLPVHNFYTDEGDVAMKCPTEVPITDRREKELADLGFIPLVHCKDTDYAAFFSVQSAQKPKLYDTDSANANARLSTQISIAGRLLVYLPQDPHIGISQRIGDEAEREHLREKVHSLIPPGETGGFIVRTVAEAAPESELAADVEYLVTLR